MHGYEEVLNQVKIHSYQSSTSLKPLSQMIKVSLRCALDFIVIWSRLKYFGMICLQACDITNGLYLKIPQLSGLLQYLLVSFAIKFFSVKFI